MSRPNPRTLRRLVVAACLATSILVPVACGGSGPTPAGPGPTSALTPVPDGSTPTPPDVTPPAITETEWGPILDVLPASFPRFPGATAGEPFAGPASGVVSVPADPDATLAWYRTALEAAGYATLDVTAPLEDGSRSIESRGPGDGCRVQTTVIPASGTTLVSILYGAGCAG